MDVRTTAGRTSTGALSYSARFILAFFTAIANNKVKRVGQFVREYPDEWKIVVNEVCDSSQHRHSAKCPKFIFLLSLRQRSTRKDLEDKYIE